MDGQINIMSLTNNKFLSSNKNMTEFFQLQIKKKKHMGKSLEDMFNISIIN